MIDFIKPDTSEGRRVYRALCTAIIKRAIADAKKENVRIVENGKYINLSTEAKLFITDLENNYFNDILNLGFYELKLIKELAGCTDWVYIPPEPKKLKKHNYPVLHWYTDGVVNVRRKSCPEGFYLGKSGNHGNQYTVKKEADK